MVFHNDSRHNAEQYLQLFDGDHAMRTSLLACSAALSLDDQVASEIIEVVLPGLGQAQDLLARIKRLGCIADIWDGSWRISEDVRIGLVGLLQDELHADRLSEIRGRVASKAEDRAKSLSPDGQITNYRVREARFHAAYQKLLMPGRMDEGAELCADIWRRASADGREATCSAADYVSDEIYHQTKNLPPELLFLKGMAARRRGDRDDARKYFHEVWNQGRPGDIYAIAAHLFGNLTRDRQIAERAYQDSIEWFPEPLHQGQVWHSLGNLLSRQSRRWEDAEEAYRTSLKLLHDPADQGQVWHSLGNLLSRQSGRWQEAEEAYRTSLKLRHDAAHQGQVWHSLGNLLSHRRRWQEAEKAYRTSLKLRHDAAHQGQVWHSVGNLLARQKERWKEAEEAYQTSLKLDLEPSGKAQVWHSLGNLLSRQTGRWKEAEEAYHTSLKLRHDSPHQVQVHASWARGILNNQSSDYDRAEKYANRALSLGSTDLRTQAVVHSILAELFERTHRLDDAIAATEAQLKAHRKLKEFRRVEEAKLRLKRLRDKIKGQ